TKLLVKFNDDRRIKEFISEAVKRSFDPAETSEDKLSAPETGGRAYDTEESSSDEEEQAEFDISLDGGASGAEGRLSVPFRENAPPESRGDLFQIGKCYIVRIYPDKVRVVDQHAAHERVMFEFFSRAADEAPVETQNLLLPERIELSAPEALLMEKVVSRFAALGFGIEHFGERSYVIQSIPAVLEAKDIKRVVYDILGDLASLDLKKTDILEEMIKLASCKAAVKSGDRLSFDEMSSLLDQLDKCELPFTCPHGRPTVIDIKPDELEKRFRRA
ncbi:MAG: hypothetical protein GF408_02310, partial [Candidatus Omnitrophica bacterium]|nr:hypothetical protein [Candidatus Omnitrophota bacterium]